MKKYIGIFLLSLTLCGTIQAQQSVFDSYTDSAISLGIKSKTYVKKYYELGIHLSDKGRYDSIGIYLDSLSQNVTSASIAYDIIFSENIFTGTIVDIGYNSDTSARFHTTYSVQVSEVIKGSLDSVVKILYESGPRGKGYVSTSYERDGFIGQQLLLFTNSFASELEILHQDYNKAPDRLKHIFVFNYSDYQTLQGNEQRIMEPYILNEGVIYDQSGRKIDMDSKSLKVLVHNFLNILNKKTA